MSKRRHKSESEERTRQSTTELRVSIRRALAQIDLDATAELPALRERRGGEDRRTWQPMPPMPFVDSNGVLVTGDRRCTPERRVSNISVAWTDREKE